MCEILFNMTKKPEIIAAVAFVLGLFLQYFPKLKDMEPYGRDLVAAVISLALPAVAFFLGAVQTCWEGTWEAAIPFVVAGLAAAAGALAGERAVASGACYKSIKKNQ